MATVRSHITRTTAGSWTLTGIQSTTGECDCCSRRITQRVFEVNHPQHGTALLGRRCAAKATGYAVTAIERQAQVAARIVEIARRVETVRAEFPTLVAEYDAFRTECRAIREAGGGNPQSLRQPVGFTLTQTVAVQDSWWGGRGWTAYATWQDYLAANI
jgi:hypothetical protein